MLLYIEPTDFNKFWCFDYKLLNYIKKNIIYLYRILKKIKVELFSYTYNLPTIFDLYIRQKNNVSTFAQTYSLKK